jgi:tetratricopeptide (TPR) repeat protein
MRVALAVAHRFALALAALLLLATGAFSDDASDKAELDQLFALLLVAPDAEAAREIDRRIWTIWTNPSDADLAARMFEVAAVQSTGNIPAALLLLDKIVADYPTYAEGWNQRATLYYLIDDYEASLADIDKVLEFEPRHFGALSGRVLIYLAQGKRSEALRDMATALAIHPFLNERQLFPELKEDMIRI